MYRPGQRYDEFDDLRKFIGHVTPALYDKWLNFPGGLTTEMRNRIEMLKGFRFERHKYYNLPIDRLRKIEDFLQNRIAKIVEYGEKADDFLKVKTVNDSVNHVNPASLEVQIKETLKADPFITYIELAEVLQISESSIARKMKELQVSGQVIRQGAAKNGYWLVVSG